MLDNIIRFSIKNKIIIGLMTLMLVILGAWSATKLPIDAVPDIQQSGTDYYSLPDACRTGSGATRYFSNRAKYCQCPKY